MDGLKETAFVVADAASPEGSIGQDLCIVLTPRSSRIDQQHGFSMGF